MPAAADPARRRHRPAGHQPPPDPLGRLVAGPFLEQLFALYERDGDDRGLPAPGAYRDYLAWLAAQDAEAGRGGLAGGAGRAGRADAGRPRPTRPAPVDPPPPRRRASCRRPRPAAAQPARRPGVTLNALLNAAWGLVLAGATGRDDVVFGTTVAGRPDRVAGVETTIGLFLNTVPVRVALDPHETVAELLRRLQDQRTGADAARVPRARRAPAARPGTAALFDTLFVLQNFVDGDEQFADARRPARHHRLLAASTPRTTR